MTIRKIPVPQLLDYSGIRVSKSIELPLEPPFTAQWAVVRPGERSHMHRHQEAEVFFIAGGRGHVESPQGDIQLTPGDTIWLPPFSQHMIVNPLGAEEDLVFLSLYWRSAESESPEMPSSDDEGRRRPTLVCVTPPTPNGDLHLGHMAGPYIAADVFARSLRARGEEARYVTGTDDHQSYTAYKAAQLGISPAEAAAFYADRIRQALEAVDVKVDAFTRASASTAHRDAVTAFFKRLWDRGHIQRRSAPALFCPPCARFVFEAFVTGLCPHCNAQTSGNGCEQCGRPNDCVDLVEPRCRVCGQVPEERQIERAIFPLEPHRARLTAFVETTEMSAHVRALCRQMLASPLPDAPVSQPAAWGLAVPVPGFDDQVVASWLEIGVIYLAAAREMSASDADDRWPAEPRVVEFFGYDNAYYITIFLTLLYASSFDDARLPAEFVTNEFYRLEGRKFSTSLNHLVTALDLVTEVSPDVVRFYLCHTRPESAQTDFRREAILATAQEVLRDGWEEWLNGLGERVRRRFGGRAPDTGLWTAEQRSFLLDLVAARAAAEASLLQPGFSTRRFTRTLCGLVERTRAFAESESHWATVPDARAIEATAIALELAAARLLAGLSWVLMPRFGARLWAELGCDGTPDAAWRSGIGYVPPDRSVRLGGAYFAPPAG